MSYKNEFNVINEPSSEAMFISNYFRKEHIKHKQEVPLVVTV